MHLPVPVLLLAPVIGWRAVAAPAVVWHIRGAHLLSELERPLESPCEA